MRKLAIIAIAATAMLCTGALSANRAEAAIFGPTTGVGVAADAVSPVESAHHRCWRGHHRWHCGRHCWRGWGGWHCGGWRY
jgi:hypothetical protein